MDYTASAAARATGVSAHRIRTWERRYGVPAPRRTATGRRLYGDEDLAVIVRMARLIDGGVPATQAAASALTGSELPAPATRPEAVDPRVLLLLGLARSLDARGLREALFRDMSEATLDEAIEDVAMPFARAMGDLWESGTVTMVYEHFASEFLRAALLARLAELELPTPDAPTVVLACPVLERHDLGNVALWVSLTARGVNVVYLGVDLPLAELVAACKDLEPAATCLTATASTTLPTLSLAVRALIEAKVSGTIFVGGPALANEQNERPVPGKHLPFSIVQAADRITSEVHKGS